MTFTFVIWEIYKYCIFKKKKDLEKHPDLEVGIREKRKAFQIQPRCTIPIKLQWKPDPGNREPPGSKIHAKSPQKRWWRGWGGGLIKSSWGLESATGPAVNHAPRKSNLRLKASWGSRVWSIGRLGDLEASFSCSSNTHRTQTTPLSDFRGTGVNSQFFCFVVERHGFCLPGVNGTLDLDLYTFFSRLWATGGAEGSWWNGGVLLKNSVLFRRWTRKENLGIILGSSLYPRQHDACASATWFSSKSLPQRGLSGFHSRQT